MKREDVYRLLEDKMLRRADYVGVPVASCGENLASVSDLGTIAVRQIDVAMQAYTGDDVYVREGVLDRLALVARLMAQRDNSLRLEVVYGYRALSVQRRLFDRYAADLKEQYSGEALLEAAHRWIAAPDVAGHPTGGAVDIQILRDGQPLDFGTPIWEFAPDSYTFSPFISREAWQNRQLLRQIMLEAGFAPYDGEWWHFSYGDKEWARYYNQPAAIYEQVEFSTKTDRTV